MSLRVANILLVLTLTVLVIAAVANSMTKPLGHDEQMYCTGAVLLAQGKMIYRDFSYVSQMPYHPLLCAALFKILNTTHYLLAGRILSTFCDILVLVCIVGIYCCVFNSFPIVGRLLAIAATLLFLFNPLVDYANGFAWNHDLIILCVMLCLRMFISTDFEKKSKRWPIVLIGCLLTVASCTRITTALVYLLFFAMLLRLPAESIKQRLKNILPFLAATAIFLIWPVWTMVLAPKAFVLNLLRIPTLNSNWLHQIGMVHNKFNLIFISLTTPGYFALIVIAIYLYLTVAQPAYRPAILKRAGALLAALLPIVFYNCLVTSDDVETIPRSTGALCNNQFRLSAVVLKKTRSG